jgi:hypothetical protein
MNEKDLALEEKTPGELLAPLVLLRRKIANYITWQTLAAIGLWSISLFWLLGWLDYLPTRWGANESPRWARLLMLILFLGGIAYLAWRLGWNRWRVAWSLPSLALAIERRFPSLGSLLSTAIQIAGGKPDQEPAISDAAKVREDLPAVDPAIREAMRRTTVARAMEEAKNIQASDVLRWEPLRWQITALSLMTVASLFAAAWRPAWTGQWIQRFIGLANVPWPRQVQMAMDGIELEVPRFSSETQRTRYLVPFQGNSVAIPKGQGGALRLSVLRESKKIPEQCMLRYRLADGSRGRTMLKRMPPQTGQSQTFTLEGPPVNAIDASIDLSAFAGDGRLLGYRVEVLDSLLVQQLLLEVTYPSYLQKSGTSFLAENLRYQPGMRLPQGTKVDLVGTANRDLDRVEFLITGRSPDPAVAQPTQGVEEPMVKIEQVVGEGKTFRIPLGSIDQTTRVDLRLWSREGVCSDRVQQYVVAAIGDAVPQAELQLDGIGTAITENAILPMKLKAVDDYGLRDQWMEVVQNEDPLWKVPVPLPPNGQLDQSLDLRQTAQEGSFQAKVGSSITMTLAAEDHFDLVPQQSHIGRATPVQLAVVTPEALLVILERRELAMRSRLELMQGELEQMQGVLIRMQNATASQPSASQPTDQPEDQSDPSAMQSLRLQQATAQAEKSYAELSGVGKEIQAIAKELRNNRIDSIDRQQRLEEKIGKPIDDLLAGPFQRLNTQLQQLRKGGSDAWMATGAADEALAATDQILAGLAEILKNLVDIQDFNELLEMVRGMVDEQKELLDATKKEQKKRVIDLFK